MVDEFKYLESTISSKRSLDIKIDGPTGKAASTLSRLETRVCVKTQVTHDRSINAFQLHSMKNLIGTNRILNIDVLFGCGPGAALGFLF